MSVTPEPMTGSPSSFVTADHWFDVSCPYCYIAQDRNRILLEGGIRLAGHGMQIHPEIGPGGAPAGLREGPAYDFLAREAEEAGLPLNWSERIPYSRPALAAFEWLNGVDPEAGERFATSVFAANFAERQDIESEDVLVALAAKAGGDPDGLRAALASSAADELLLRSEALAVKAGVQSTPTWVAGDQKVSGLHPRRWFEEWAAVLVR